MGILRRAYTRDGFTYRDVKNLRARTSPSYTAGGAVFPNTLSTQFDGVDESAYVTPNAALDPTGALTTSFWVKGTAAADDGLVTKWGPGSPAAAGWMVRSKSDGTVDVHCMRDGNFGGPYKLYVSSVTVVEASTWNHFAFTFQGGGSGTLKLYKNGVEDTTPTKSVDGSMATIFAGTGQPITIGAINNGSGSPPTFESGFFTGNIDEVGFWDIALSGAEVSEVYNSGIPTDLTAHSQSANLQGWWRMGDGSTFPTINDDSSNSNTATMVNMESGDFVSDTP